MTPGDRVLSVDGALLDAGQAGVQSMVDRIKQGPPEQTLRLERERDQQSDTISLRRSTNRGKGASEPSCRRISAVPDGRPMALAN